VDSLARHAACSLIAEECALNDAFKIQELEEEAHTKEEAFVSFFFGETKDVVDMSASGERLSAKRSTLMRCADSALARKFDDAVWTQPARGASSDSEDDYEPIDFSAYCFGKMVDHLRLLALTSNDAESVSAPVIRADELNNFERLVKYYFPGREDWFIGGIKSAILSDGHAQLATPLLGWLKQVQGLIVRNFELLYRASRDGWNAANFHSACDYRGPTVTIIRCTDGFIFGGFSDVPWTSSGDYARSDRAFLFSLHNAVGLAPTKLPLNGSSNDTAVYCHQSYGPTFGYGNDLQIAKLPQSNHSQINLGETYQVPPGQNGNFLTGSSSFRAAEIEVFCVT